MLTKLILRNTPVRIGLFTSLAIIVAKMLSVVMVYDFFRFDAYLAIVAVSFLTIGYLLTAGKERVGTMSANPDHPVRDEAKQMLKSLSSRELSILEMIASGNTNKEIAMNLGIELSTVKTHINHIYAKTNCKNRKEAREKRNEWAQLKLVS